MTTTFPASGAGRQLNLKETRMTTAENTLRHVEQQMLMARPWDAAEPESIWTITGEYPGKRHRFTNCLAVALPGHVTSSDRPLFMFIGILATVNDPVDPAWITNARPLLLVDRDNPSEPYWEDDRVWLGRGNDA